MFLHVFFLWTFVRRGHKVPVAGVRIEGFQRIPHDRDAGNTATWIVPVNTASAAVNG